MTDEELEEYQKERDRAAYEKIGMSMDRMLGNVPDSLPGRKRQRVILGEDLTEQTYDPLRR